MKKKCLLLCILNKYQFKILICSRYRLSLYLSWFDTRFKITISLAELVWLLTVATRLKYFRGWDDIWYWMISEIQTGLSWNEMVHKRKMTAQKAITGEHQCHCHTLGWVYLVVWSWCQPNHPPISHFHLWMISTLNIWTLLNLNDPAHRELSLVGGCC